MRKIIFIGTIIVIIILINVIVKKSFSSIFLFNAFSLNRKCYTLSYFIYIYIYFVSQFQIPTLDGTVHNYRVHKDYFYSSSMQGLS